MYSKLHQTFVTTAGRIKEKIARGSWAVTAASGPKEPGF